MKKALLVTVTTVKQFRDKKKKKDRKRVWHYRACVKAELWNFEAVTSCANFGPSVKASLTWETFL